VEILLSLDRRRPEPLHAQLERQLREAIRAGRLVAGHRLPSTRELARDLGVSRRLVVEAYAQLTAEGYLSARQGAPTRVAGGDPGGPSAAAAPPRRAPLPYEFHPGQPDLAGFPRTAWLRSARAATRAAADADLGYGDPRGAPALRAAVAAYLGRSRGAGADAARIVICNGAAQGVALVCRALRARGARRLAVEDPGFFVHRWVAAHAGLECVAVGVDEHGLRTDALAAARADAVLVTPAHQAPTGSVLAPHRRAELMRWCEAGDRIVIEDDYDAEYRYDRAPVGALQGLAPERVAYVGSASKVLAPALRLGWLALPAALADAVAAEKALEDHGSATLEQLALADFLARGELDRHLRRMRPRYRRRRDALADALARELPGCGLRGTPAGLHVLATLPDGLAEEPVVAAARRRGVGVHGLGLYRMQSSGAPGLVLGYAGLSPPAIEAGVRRLATAVADVRAAG
jgi:GntR family transcriptional regulator / MocR family aminotransferase